MNVNVSIFQFVYILELKLQCYARQLDKRKKQIKVNLEFMFLLHLGFFLVIYNLFLDAEMIQPTNAA